VIGLDGDSDRQNFGQIHTLIPICDDITKLKACVVFVKMEHLLFFLKK